jgi:hypothetical protein
LGSGIDDDGDGDGHGDDANDAFIVVGYEVRAMGVRSGFIPTVIVCFDATFVIMRLLH